MEANKENIENNKENVEVIKEVSISKPKKKVSNSIFSKDEKYKNKLEEIKDKYKEEKKNIKEKKIKIIGTMFDSAFEDLGILDEIYKKRRDKDFKEKINKFCIKAFEKALAEEEDVIFESYNKYDNDKIVELEVENGQEEESL